MDPNKNPPTARGGIQAAMAAENAVVAKHPDKPQAQTSSIRPSSQQLETVPKANATGEPMLNPAPAAIPPLVEAPEPFEGEVTPAKREAFIAEALAAYKITLKGVRTRLEFEITNPQGLNPNTEAAKGSLSAVLKGIAQCDLLLSEMKKD